MHPLNSAEEARNSKHVGQMFRQAFLDVANLLSFHDGIARTAEGLFFIEKLHNEVKYIPGSRV